MRTYASTAKPYKGIGMEGAIARWYAALTGRSMAEFRSLAGRVAGELSPGSCVLEVAPGPGYFAIELAKLGDYRVTGLDISETLVKIARAHAESAGARVEFQHGDASRMPFDAEQFDYIMCRAAFKNFAAPVAALREMRRVLRPGGRALIVDMRRDASPDAIKQAAGEIKAGALNRLIVYLTFRFMLLKRAYTKAEFERMAAEAGFREPEINENMIGLEITLRK